MQDHECHKCSGERTRAVRLVMDLLFALRNIKGQARNMDLIKLAKRIKKAKQERDV